MNYWLCITNEENWDIVRKNEIWGVNQKHKEKILNVKEGDPLVFYVKPKRIGGILETTSKPFKENKVIFKSGIFPYRVKLKSIIIPRKFLEFRPLVSKLQFIINKKMWKGRLQGRAMISIQKDDFELVNVKLENLKERETHDLK